MNKGGFRVVGNNVTWNALEIIKIDHKCNFNTIKKYGFERRSLQAWFDFEFHCLNKCLGMEELILNYDLDLNPGDDRILGLHTLT
jgi:hypothetical protein